MKRYYVYILSSDTGTLYVGVTNNLMRRMQEHRNSVTHSFTRKYHIHRLLYFEETENILTAIEREKEIKRWNRKKKLNLVKNTNPTYKDLCDGWFDNEQEN